MVIHSYTATTMTRIPAELTDRIIDFLHSDKKTLATCALVCKSWIPSSRFHLFEKLHINHETTRTFMDLLQSNNSTIEKYAQTLWILNWKRMVQLAPYLDRFLAFKSLVITGTQSDMKETHADLCLWFHGITNLDVMSFQFTNTNCFSRFLDAFPLLELLRINLSGLSHHFPDDAQSSTISLPLRIRVLHMAISSSMLPFLLNIHFPPLAELMLCRVSTNDLLDIDHWLRSLPPTLRALSIRFSSHTSKHVMSSRMER
jgi:hypothetical protein